MIPPPSLCPPFRHEVDYYLPFLKYSYDAEDVLSLSARKIMNMQKNVESN